MPAPIARFSHRPVGRPAPLPKGFHHGNLRQALLDAALAASDIEGISLRQIATNVGVTAAAAYRHFENRDDLLDEVARIGFDRLEARFVLAFDITRAPADAHEAQARLVRLALAYLQFADDEPALWRLMFGVQGASYRAAAQPQGRRTSYEYLPAALLGLHRTGFIPREANERDALFVWSAVHGAASLRNGRIAPAQVPVAQLAQEVALHAIRSLQ